MSKLNLKTGDEISISTKNGRVLYGIFVDFKQGHLSAIGELGIIFTFPFKSILEVSKI